MCESGSAGSGVISEVRKHINDLYEDLRDGHNLISLLEVLSGDTLPRERGRMRFHRLQNVQIALDYLKRRQVKLVNIRNDDITDGNPKLTLGLIWTIILHFQISEIHVTGESEDMTAKERLLLWSKQITDGYVGVRCDNFTTSWRDGRLFNAIIHKYRPDLIDISSVSAQTNRSNLEQAFCVAEQLGVARLLDPEDVDVQSPDEKSVITYVSTLYDAFPKVPDGVEGINPNDVDIKWVEYQNMIKYLSQWIKHNVAIMSDRSFPNNPVELKALYTQYLQFKEHEIPVKENEKTKIKNLYKMLEMWIEFGRIQLPPGHHPNDVEKEWGKLIVAMLEREKSLRPEMERLEMLQQIANRVQRDCVNGEDKLALARTALQSDAKRLESGIQFINEAEIAGYLLECENILRQQVVDIQILLDGKFPFADQLVQRVSKLRDDLLTLRAECSSIYSKGRTLTTEQTKMMISGITQSLNSGFSQNINSSLTPALTPALTPGGLGTPGSTFTSSLTPCLTPSLTPALTPGMQPVSVHSYMGSGGGGVGGGMDPGGLMQLKHIQIRKPLLKSSLADPNMTEEEVNMKYVQDLLNWVEEMQIQLERSEWGSDLPSVEMHLENHKNVHRAIEEFQMSLKDAKLSEIQMTIPLKLTYSDKLSKLEKQYERLLTCSRERQSSLESLQDFVSQATQELIWLNEKEEEEVAFDWSDRNSHISKKRDYHADLMRELDEKEEAIKSVQDKAERLMLKNHPARLTIEAYRAAMQTQWSWILQLCSCVEQHLKENAVYFEYFSDAKESLDYLKNLQDSIQRKYSCDRTSSLHRLEDLIQESMDEKEELLQYRNTVAGLVGRAKNIVQLRPRNPESSLRSSIPVRAICDYRQIEITIYKDDECVLANNSHRAKWKVINPAGNEAMVPSVCFTVPPPNKEAVDMAARIEQVYQNVLSLWHHSHINMKSVVSYHYLMADIRAIRNWNVSSIKTMLPGEHQQVLSNLESHFDEFLEDSEESEVFTVADCTQLERDVAACKEYYQELLRSAEREEHEESVYNQYISEIRNFRMHLEAHEEHLIRQIRTPLERDDLEQSLQRITEHEKKTAELNKLKEDLDVLKEKCEVFLRQAAGSPSAPTLSSELSVVIQSMGQVHSMSSIYMDKLKTVSLVVNHSQSAEALVKAFESKLYEEEAINSDVKSIENVISTLKQWRTEIDEKQEVFHDMEDELQKARVVSDRMFKAHNERDFDLDWHKEKADQLSERWQNIHSQIDSRLRDLDGISKSLKHYKDSFGSLDEWVREMEATQLKAQENKPDDSKALAELLNKQKVLVGEIEQIQGKIDECQKYSEHYSSAMKDYELQLMTFRAMVDSQHKSPLKKRRLNSSSDAIQQEFMDLRTRYTALVTLMTQFVKFASETLKRTEDEERSVDEEKREHGDKVSKLLHWMSSVKPTMSNDGNSLKDNNANTDTSNKSQVSVEEMVTKKEQIAEALRATQTMLNKHSDKMTEEERATAQEQLRALTQAYNEISQQCSDQTASAEEVGLKTLCLSVLPLSFMMPSHLPWSDSHVLMDWDDDHMFKSTQNHSPELHKPRKCIQSSHITSVSLSEVAAAREGSMSDDLIIKLIEVNQGGDGVTLGYTGDTLTLEQAFQLGLIPASVYVKTLERQKACQEMMNPDTAEYLSLSEPEGAVEPSEVNRLILKCLSRDKSLASGRNIRTLRSASDGFGDEETMLVGESDSEEGKYRTEASETAQSQYSDDCLKMDAAVQCDLMSSSSTLIMLGNRQQFVGLVLPHSGEITTVSTSSQHDERSTSSQFSSSLFSNRSKIAAFYIPEYSEVIDFSTAIQNSFIDRYTAEVLKSVVIPDVFPDVNHLNDKFSSWLMYKNLSTDGCHHAACSSEVNVPSPSEAKQLFLSYLMMNSYVDPQSGQRVLILDNQLSKITQAFLDDPTFFGNTYQSFTHLPGPPNDNTVSGQAGSEISLHINEDTEEMLAHVPHCFHPQDFGFGANEEISFEEGTYYEAFESHSFVSSGSVRMSCDEKSHPNEKTLKGNLDEFLGGTCTVMDITEYEEEIVFQNNTNWTKSGDLGESIWGNRLQIDFGDVDNRHPSPPSSPEMSVSSTSCSVKTRNTDSPPTFQSERSCHQIPPRYNVESPDSKTQRVNVSRADVSCTMSETEETEHDTSGKYFDLEETPHKRLAEDKTTEELPDLQSDKMKSVLGDKNTTATLPQQMTLKKCQAEQPSLLKSDWTDNTSKLGQFRLSEEENTDLDPKVTFYPEGNSRHPMYDLSLIKMTEDENAERKVAVMMLDLSDEGGANKGHGGDDGSQYIGCATGEISHYVHGSLLPDSNLDPQMSSAFSLGELTPPQLRHTHKFTPLAENSESPTMSNSLLAARMDPYSDGIELAAPAVQSRPSHLSETDPGISADYENQTQHATFAYLSDKFGRQPADSIASDRCHARMENEGINEGGKGPFLSNYSVLHGETTGENNPNAVWSPLDSNTTLSVNQSSPRKLLESATFSISHSNDKDSPTDGSRVTVPPQTLFHSENNISIESDPSGCQSGESWGTRVPPQHPRSSQLPAGSVEAIAAQTLNQKGSDGQDLILTADDTKMFAEAFSPECDSSLNVSNATLQISASKKQKEKRNPDVDCDSSLNITSATLPVSASEPMEEKVNPDNGYETCLNVRTGTLFSAPERRNEEVNPDMDWDGSLTVSSDALAVSAYGRRGEVNPDTDDGSCLNSTRGTVLVSAPEMKRKPVNLDIGCDSISDTTSATLQFSASEKEKGKNQDMDCDSLNVSSDALHVSAHGRREELNPDVDCDRSLNGTHAALQVSAFEKQKEKGNPEIGCDSRLNTTHGTLLASVPEMEEETVNPDIGSDCSLNSARAALQVSASEKQKPKINLDMDCDSSLNTTSGTLQVSAPETKGETVNPDFGCDRSSNTTRGTLQVPASEKQKEKIHPDMDGDSSLNVSSDALLVSSYSRRAEGINPGNDFDSSSNTTRATLQVSAAEKEKGKNQDMDCDSLNVSSDALLVSTCGKREKGVNPFNDCDSSSNTTRAALQVPASETQGKTINPDTGCNRSPDTTSAALKVSASEKQKQKINQDMDCDSSLNTTGGALQVSAPERSDEAVNPDMGWDSFNTTHGTLLASVPEMEEETVNPDIGIDSSLNSTRAPLQVSASEKQEQKINQDMDRDSSLNTTGAALQVSAPERRDEELKPDMERDSSLNVSSEALVVSAYGRRGEVNPDIDCDGGLNTTHGTLLFSAAEMKEGKLNPDIGSDSSLNTTNATLQGSAFEGREKVNPNIDLGRCNTGIRDSLVSEAELDRSRSDVSEDHHVAHYSPSDSSQSSSLSSSNGLKAHEDGPEELILRRTDVSDFQKAQTQDLESSSALDLNSPQALYEHSWPEFTQPTSVDFAADLPEKNTLQSNSKHTGDPKMKFEEEKVSERTEQPEASGIQLQLLQVFKAVSSSQDLSVLQEVMETLSSALGGDSLVEDRWHTLESIKEESSEGEDEGSAADDTASCHTAARTQQPSDTQEDEDYLECVGRLQDHADVLDDVKKDLPTQVPTCTSMEELQIQIDEFQDTEDSLLSEARLRLEDATFEIQCFISENAQFLSPSQSSCLLKSLSSAQRGLRDQIDRAAAQRSALEGLLEAREGENRDQSLLERHKEFAEKLEDVCDSLTLTENRLIGHQQQAGNAESVSDLQQYQQEHQALQKDVLTNASALNEVISSTKKFLDENRSKLMPNQVASIESKLEEAKDRAKLINQRAEESRKDLEKVVTTAIKQESEKAAAVERLEESKNKIEGLLGWISNIGNQNNGGQEQTDHISAENGNLPEETSVKAVMGEDDDANGNALQTAENDSGGETGGDNDASHDLEKQYDRVKARHQEILSQQQDLIMATQSAQALLDKQANVLSPEEKESLQKNIQDLKQRYEASLTQAEQQMKQVQGVQEELKKFTDDCDEFESWLNQAEAEMEELGAPAGSHNVLSDKLQQQRSFSEDVISHKGDLRFITISGQKVLDVAKACGSADPAAKNTELRVDTSGTCTAVQEKLDSAASRYKALHSQCNLLGNNLKEVVDKYKKYEESSAGLSKWLNSSEEESRKHQSEAISADPQTLQRQLEDTKALQGQMMGHQTAIDTLRKTAEALITSEGDLLSNTDEIQETVDDIVERYDNLSKSVSDRNQKLQITLTRSMSVQDGLDEMMGWMEGVEARVKEKGQIPLDSASIGEILGKEAALEQDIASRKSSVYTMKSKVKTFVETADPSDAVLLKSKMDALSQRFFDACDKHKQKVSQLERLKEKVEQFEDVADKVQQFVVKRSQELQETDGPGSTFNELSKLMEDTKADMAECARDLEKLQTLSKDLSEMSTDGNRVQIQSKMDDLTNVFNTFKDTVKEKEEELSSCQDQLGEFRSAASALSKWLEETNDKVPAVQPSSTEKSLEKDLQIVNGLLDEWTSKGPSVEDVNSKGSALCSLITLLTSPAKTKTTNKSALTNGGGPASHAYLTNKELMGIQQNMTFISEGYAKLGETLKSRAAELSSSVQEVKEARKETEDMMTWLKDMKKTAASWGGTATEKDSVKTQLEQQKAFEDDMKQKQEQLQKLREKLLNLIKTHPNSPEAAKWKQMLAEIDAAWAEVSGSVEERKQHLEQSNKNLDVFQSTELQLGQWLSEKELMMSVLGPLSIDPNMLKMQKQQVQILQNEFKSRKPQYEQLEEAAAAILSSSDGQDASSGKAVKEQLAAVTQKWEGLTGQLDQRDGLIDQAAVKTGQFQELLRSLSQTASQLESQLTNHHSHSTQPDAVKKQLEDVQNISAQLRDEKKKLKNAEAINAELTAMVTEDYLKADLARQLESVSRPFKQLEEKAAQQIEQLNSTFASSQQFHQTSKDFQAWLGEKLQDQSGPQPVSAKVEVLQQSLEEHSKLQKALGDHEEAYNTITGEGEMLLHNTDGAEKLALQGQLTTLASNWEEVKKSAAEHAEKLQTALLKSQKYQEHAEKLSSWIQECEANEGRVKLTADPVAVEDSLSQVKALQKDVDKHRGLVEQLNTAAESLLEVANADTEAVKEEKSSIGKRVDKLFEGLQGKRDSLEKISRTVKEFNDALKEAKGHLEGAKKQVDAYESQGVQAYSNKNLANMKAQHKSLEGVQNQVEHMKALAKDLVVEVPDADGVTDLLLQADSLEKDYSSLDRKLEDTCHVLEGKLQGIGQFQNSLREMFTRFTELDDELDGMSPVNLDLTALKEQQESIQSFVAKLRELMANTANAGDSCKKMLETESSPDLLGLKRDLDALSKQCGKLLDRAKGREEQVQSTLATLEDLYRQLHQMEDKLCRAVDKEASQEAVGMETDVINQQLEAFKAFQKDDIDPLQTQLQDINSLGQGLIQNAAKGTSTKKLEDDLEGVNSKWNTLNKKIAERSAQLHEALLHCGRFQDALESLLSWLTDTEELVASQKPPSAEYKVVKAQIQEQKLLQRLLDDRKPTVELIKKEGGKVAELAESVDKEKVAKEIECLGQRWDALLKKAENRHKQLESILVVTQQFHETLEPLSDWLAATEKHLVNAEPIGTETSKLEEQISQHKALEEEIMNHSKDLFQAVSLGQMLKAVSSADDKEFVQTKLDNTQGSYIELQERCRRKAEMLQQALANAQHFGEHEVALMNWLSEVHARLSEASVEDYRIDVLEKQLAEQRELQSDIDLRKKNVDQAVSNGLELLKQTTGDEVVVIQGKLDGIKAKYAEINSMSDNVLKTLERVLSLSSKLQHTHEDLHSWLEKAEVEISSFSDQEPVGEQLMQSQSRQRALLKETKDQKPVLDKLNELSGSLLDLIPWHTRESLDKLVTEDNERYRAVCDTITQQVDQINADILKSQQFEQAADAELSWLAEAEKKLLSVGEIRLEQDQTAAQLQAQKIFSMDIMRHKDAVDDIVKTGKAIMSSKNPEEKQLLKAKTKSLLEKYGVVSQLNSERCLQLERAQSLATQFWETYEELSPWLQEAIGTFSQLPPPAIEYETLRQQQEELRQMRELIAEHKPHIDKMNKTGPQLLELSPTEGAPIKEKYTSTDQLYSKLKADVKQRAATLDEAISKSTQFHDKIDPMLESLERIAERLRQPPSISVEVDKIKEQISENKAVSMDLEKLQPSYDTLRQRGEEMIARSEGADKDISAKAVQDKLDHMVFLWSDIQALQEEREAKLLDVMDLAEKFWCDHCALIVTIKDCQDLLKELEEPGVDPSVVKQQQEFVEGFKEEVDGLQEELDVVRNQGAVLMTACGEPDKPVIKKSVDEVNSAWENLNKTWRERIERLEEAMQAAVQFQDGLQGMFDGVDILESKLDSMSPVGTDLETVKQQIVELKEFKQEAYQLQIEMERLNHQAGLLLKKVTEEADRCAIQEPMSELKMLLDNMDEKIISRQHKLEGGLLALGQFQHALDELLAWMSHTEELLNEQRKACGDPKAIEIELAKHHVLQIDVLAHKSTVETVNKAGKDLVESSAGEEASCLQSKLENLNQRWKSILEKTEQRKQQLESSLLQAQGFHGEIEDMQQWLKDTERQLLASKAVGGLPDTAREQLNAHLELCSAFEAKEELYRELLNKGHQLLATTPEGPDSNTEQDLGNLKEKWEAVQAKVAERKVKLEEAFTLATDFHNSLQDFINWLTQAEQTLNMVSPASLILETILFQIDEHKMFVTEVNSHRDHIIDLDKTGTHLKYFSQKQDVVLIKNLLLSVQGRWEKLVQRSVERGRLLDDARKRAKQFHETFNKLMEWLDESEKTLDSEVEIANEPDKIKTQLAQHKEFQKALGSKHSVYDTTARTGRALKDKTSLQDDNQKLDDMLSELRDKWDTVCGKSVERQNKLEEALLFSGQFTDALQALIDWLYRVEPQLAEDQPVHGDIDLVLNLIDNHKVFQKELGKRTVSVQALKRSARELVESSHDDSSWVKVQMQELGTRWETVCNLSVSKQARLEQALCQAEEFHSTVHILLEWLAEAEQSLRFHGSLPDDEEALRVLIEQHKDFMKKLEEKRVALNKATNMGEAILSICHPDSITTIKHWNTIIKARFEEVQAWARQHQQRLAAALTDQLATQELLENLLTWLQWAESNLNDKDKEALPQEIEEVKSLISEHQAFMEEMTRKQPDVDKITKTHKRKAAAEPQIQSQIPVLDKGRTGRKRSPTQAMYASTTQAPIETKNPRVNLLVTKWQHVWLLALDRRRKLNDALDRLEELKEFANFDFDVWRKRYMRWMNHKKSRVMDFFRRIDKDQDGKVTRQEFIEGILSSSKARLTSDLFDRIPHQPSGDERRAAHRLSAEDMQIGANKYRFGDSQQLRLVRILRSTVMVRVGGGWMALDEFLVKNDPCRAKGRTNVELREKFILPEGTTQVMASFRYRGRRSRPSSRGASPNRSTSSQSCPVPSHQAATSTPKTPQSITRNYDKPWLTNSKPSTPLKSSDSFGSPGSSSESAAVQGSKLRLPGYLSGKGFQSGEEGTLISAAVLKARAQTGESRKNSSRPGSKAGSRGSSRRGSDASDFDISDIQSVCSDASESVGESARTTPRSAARQHGGKPSKIPTPQRRTTPTSKLAKGSKR
uniref:Dystonin n=1 Tax=Salarias fasciatus TaxID=181472 RepID=A0A672IGU0_SALFA